MTIILSLPKTIIFNFRVLSFNQAIKLPIYIYNNMVIDEVHKGIIQINDNIKTFMVKLGDNGSKGVCTIKTDI